MAGVAQVWLTEKELRMLLTGVKCWWLGGPELRAKLRDAHTAVQCRVPDYPRRLTHGVVDL